MRFEGKHPFGDRDRWIDRFEIALQKYRRRFDKAGSLFEMELETSRYPSGFSRLRKFYGEIIFQLRGRREESMEKVSGYICIRSWYSWNFVKGYCQVGWMVYRRSWVIGECCCEWLYVRDYCVAFRIERMMIYASRRYLFFLSFLLYTKRNLFVLLIYGT